MTLKTTRWSPYVIPLCLTIFFLWISSYVMGISLSDDSGYLQGGADFKWNSFYYRQRWGPLYWLWFKLLTVVCANPISRYFLSWGIVVSFIAMVPSWMKTPSAWLYSFIVVVYPFLTIGPYVSLFAAAIAVFGMCLVLRRPESFASVAGICCAVSFILAFVRPEFNDGLYLSSLLTILLVAGGRLRAPTGSASASPRRPWSRDMAMAAMALFLAATIHTLEKHGGHERAGMAFAQHYNIQAAARGLVPAPIAWKLNYAQQVFHVDMQHTSADTTATMADYFHGNPRLFLEFLVRNFFDPGCLIPLALLAAAILWPWLRRDARRFRPASIFLCLIALPPMAGVVFIYPDPHYWVIFVPALTVYVLHVIKPPGWAETPSLPWVLGSGFALIWLLNIGFQWRDPIMRWDIHQNRRDLNRIQCIREVDLLADPTNPNVLDSAGIVPVYLTFPFSRKIVSTGTLSDWAHFHDWVDATRPAWISTDPGLASQYHVSSAQMETLLEDRLGYTPHPCTFDADLTVYTHDLH